MGSAGGAIAILGAETLVGKFRFADWLGKFSDQSCFRLEGSRQQTYDNDLQQGKPSPNDVLTFRSLLPPQPSRASEDAERDCLVD